MTKERKKQGQRRDQDIEKAVELADRLGKLADRAECASRDYGCLVMFGVIRDCSYRIKQEAMRELRVHELARERKKKGGMP